MQLGKDDVDNEVDNESDNTKQGKQYICPECGSVLEQKFPSTNNSIFPGLLGAILGGAGGGLLFAAISFLFPRFWCNKCNKCIPRGVLLLGKIGYENGGKYDGEICDGKPHGQGTMIFLDGSKYVGEWKDGTMHGQGEFIYSDNSQNDDAISDTKIVEQETAILPSADKYAGEVQKDIARLQDINLSSNEQQQIYEKTTDSFYKGKNEDSNFEQILPVTLDRKANPTGIGGWLSIVVIRLILGPIIAIGEISNINSQYYYYSIPDEVKSWIYVNIFMIVICPIVLNFFFWSKRASFPKMFIIYNVIYIIILSAYTFVFPDDIGTLLGNMVWPIILLIYTLKSKRVKNTFIRV